MRLPIQIEGIIFRRNNGKIEFLLLKRNKERGGFWQPITGGLEEGETIKQTLLRELKEETGVEEAKIINLNYSFQFKENDLWLTEFVFSIEISSKEKIKISSEHDEYLWCDLNTALDKLKWDTNKQAFKKTFEKIEGD